MAIAERKRTYLDALTCKKTKDLPYWGPPYRASIGLMDEFEKGPANGGPDGFGVIWEVTLDGSIPSSKSFLLKDICDWKKVVKFPDLEAIDWRAKAERELSRFDRDSQVIEYSLGNAHFERLVALMGFENGLCALVEDPDACEEFMQAFTEYRIAFIRKIAEYYHPDTICHYDDVAHLRGPFMSRAVYQKVIKPYHKLVNDECRRHGIIPIQHCCGKAESLIEDFIDEGAQCWTSVQPENDIPGLLRKYGDRISLAGGFDTTKVANIAHFTAEDIRREVREAAKRCAVTGSSFILGNFTLSDSPDMTWEEIIAAANDEAMRIGKNFYA